MWGKIIIPMYRLWLNGLYGLYGPRCPLFSKRPINLISLSLSTPTPQHQNTHFRKQPKLNTQSLVTPDGQVIPKGLCIKFNTRGQRCSAGNSCNYSHRCPKCNAFHTLYESCNDYMRRYENRQKSVNGPSTLSRNKPLPYKTDRRQ